MLVSTRLWPIAIYLIFGALFGLLTYRHRHLFSEGPTQRDDGPAPGVLEGRLFWTLMCTCLWPVMALTGLHTAWLLSSRRRAARAQAQLSSDASKRGSPPD